MRPSIASRIELASTKAYKGGLRIAFTQESHMAIFGSGGIGEERIYLRPFPFPTTAGAQFGVSEWVSHCKDRYSMEDVR